MQAHSNRMVNCPSDEVLLGYGRNELSAEQSHAVSSHLLFCDACLEYLNLLMSGERKPEVANPDSNETHFERSRSEMIYRFRPPQLKREVEPKSWDDFRTAGGELRVGQIWRPKSKKIVVPGHNDSQLLSVTDLESSPHLVVITNTMCPPVQSDNTTYHIIRVAPLDADLDCVAEDDFVVSEKDSLLGYSFLVQAWNEQVMLAENLECLLAEFNETEHAMLLEQLKSIGESELTEGAFSLEAAIMKGRYSDPIMRYRAKEYEETSYLRTPAQSLQDSAVSYEELEEYSDTITEGATSSTLPTATEYISEIIRKTRISENVWSAGWQPEAARAAASGRTSQRFYNSDRSLSATLRPVGKRMLLRIEGEIDKWEGTLVPFFWRSRVKDVGEYQCFFAVLSKDETTGLSSAELKLGSLDEIAHRGLPETPFSVQDLSTKMSDAIRNSIVSAFSNHELDAWYELSKRKDLDPSVRAIIKEEIGRN